MKKIIFFILLLFIPFLSQASTIKASQPELVIDVPFSKNENGVVQFNSIQDTFEEGSGEYFVEDGTLKIISESPLKVEALMMFPDGASAEFAQKLVEPSFIFHIFRTFIHTDTNSIVLSITPINDAGKTFGNTVRGKVTRQKALRILKQFSKALSFDDLISLNPNAEHTIIGLSPSDELSTLATGKQYKQVLSALISEK